MEFLHLNTTPCPYRQWFLNFESVHILVISKIFKTNIQLGLRIGQKITELFTQMFRHPSTSCLICNHRVVNPNFPVKNSTFVTRTIRRIKAVELLEWAR